MSGHVPQIEASLRRLLSQAPGAFVIFEDSRSGKFVQFAGSSSEPLLLDLPIQTLGPDELPRAVRLFAEYGVHQEQWGVSDRPDGANSGQQSGFNMKLETNVARAAEVASRVFQEVYRLPVDFSLLVTEG